MKANQPLVEYIKVQTRTDAQLKRLLRSASREARRIIAANPNSLRAMQARLNLSQMEMWAGVKSQTAAGMVDAASAAARTQALYDAELLRAIGWDTPWHRQSLMASAQRSVRNVESRARNAIRLSDRVYKNQALATGRIADIIDTQIGMGASAKDIARSVAAYISPDVPGGVSYAAMRLGRTELNNAFHTTQIDGYKSNPFVEYAKWELSGSHGSPDECDEYAEGGHYRGGDPGVFKIEEVPMKPHPNCLCYTTPVMMARDEFVKGFKDGKFDQYLDSVINGGQDGLIA